jgi:glycosyltransferase involved in cell wall biosynthesis
MRVDLHVHSKYSRRPTQWFLKKIGCPESFTEPLQLYRVAMRRGMTHVTISDHNTIEGVLEIAHLDNVFISEELTTYFPEDGCKLHVLAWNITEAQHRDLQKARQNVFELVDHLNREKIAHALAHPLYAINGKMSVEHFERCLLLFKTFELNGARNDRENRCLESVSASLMPEDIDRLSERFGLEPKIDESWKKNLVGGSDDHSSLTIARCFTEMRGEDRVRRFLAGVEGGRAVVERSPSTPRTLAHNLYGIAYQYYKKRLGLDRYVKKDLLMTFLDRSLRCADDTEPGLFSRICLFWRHRRRAKRKPPVPESLTHLLGQETRRLIQDTPSFAAVVENGGRLAVQPERTWFNFVNQTANGALRHFADHLMDQLSGANLFNIFQTLGSAAGLYTLIGPYFIAYALFCQDRETSRTLEKKYVTRNPVEGDALRVAHFTDTFYEVNGVALTLQQQVCVALKTEKKLTLVTCETERHERRPGIENFKPIGVYSLPEYPEQKIFCPPLLEMLDFCYEKEFNHIHSATPGPIGLAALAVARVLKLPITGTYHTQIPQYAEFLTGDPGIEEISWKYILWYYDQMDTIYAPSRSTRSELVDKGIAAEKIRIYPRGIDVSRFHPGKRNGFFKSRFDIRAGTKLLYVGRISKEKNLHVLQAAYRKLLSVVGDVHLIVVGDGPYLPEMKTAMAGMPCTFTGYLSGEALCAAYASSDVFVFPSATDTFGNVILEAQASGLPVIVTDRGGPAENLSPDRTGLVVPANDVGALEEAMRLLCTDDFLRRRMGAAARRYMEDRSFEAAFIRTWEMYRNPYAGKGPAFARAG